MLKEEYLVRACRKKAKIKLLSSYNDNLKRTLVLPLYIYLRLLASPNSKRLQVEQLGSYSDGCTLSGGSIKGPGERVI